MPERIWRTSGAQVTLVTKSGTNTVHGSLYEYNRNTATSANSFFNNLSGIPRQKLIRNVYGGSVGGPVWKDRLFYFLNYEGRQDRSDAPGLRIIDCEFRSRHFYLFTHGWHGRQAEPTAGHCNRSRAYRPDRQHSSYLRVTRCQHFTQGDTLNTAGYRFNAPSRCDGTHTSLSWTITSMRRAVIKYSGAATCRTITSFRMLQRPSRNSPAIHPRASSWTTAKVTQRATQPC